MSTSSFDSFNFDSAITWHLDQVRKLRSSTGLFTASASDVTTGYDKAWLRDIYFMTLGFKFTGEMDVVKDTAKALLKILAKHKEKIVWAVNNKPFETWQYIHARYHPETFEEFWEEWGNKQNDAVGEVLYLIAECEVSGHQVVETDEEKELVQILVNYVNAIEYWNDADSGIWEENQEVRASSIGSVVRALITAKQLPYIVIPEGAIEKGEQALRRLLPRETANRFCDLALLTLIFPFEVTTEEEAAIASTNMNKIFCSFVINNKWCIAYFYYYVNTIYFLSLIINYPFFKRSPTSTSATTYILSAHPRGIF